MRQHQVMSPEAAGADKAGFSDLRFRRLYIKVKGSLEFYKKYNL
jgi:hypothetical protein